MFRTRRFETYWRTNYHHVADILTSIDVCQFGNANDELELQVAFVEEFRRNLRDSDPDSIFNDCFLADQFVKLLMDYCDFWHCLYRQSYHRSWDKLQDIQSRLRLIKRFSSKHNVNLLSFFEAQCGNLERLYPHKIFLSSEIMFDGVRCSICGKNMNSFDCPHVPGDLYRGDLAIGTITNITHVAAVALVENPQDKRCVIIYPEDSGHFRLIAYLSELIVQQEISPLRFDGVEFTTVKIKHNQPLKNKRNELCPCGSNRKYKNCCLNKEHIERPHVNVIGKRTSVKEMLSDLIS